MRCPDEDRLHLLIDIVNNLTKWLKKHGIMAPKLVYWIPKYILMRNNKTPSCSFDICLHSYGVW